MLNDPTAPIALVVDDDPMILMHAAGILEEAGFRPIEAYDVEEALSQLERFDGDITLLFTDVNMTGDRDGFELARETSKRWPDIKILVASGAMAPKEGDLPEGAVFVAKPFSANIIYDRLQELLPDGAKPEPLKKR